MNIHTASNSVERRQFGPRVAELNREGTAMLIPTVICGETVKSK